MEHVLMYTFRSSEPQFFPPWKETQEPPSTRDSSSIGKWISCMARADPSSAAGKSIGKTDRCFLLFSFFLFEIHSNASLINLRDITPTKVGTGSCRGKKEKTSRDFPIRRFASRSKAGEPMAGGPTIWPSRRLSAGDVINSLQPQQFVGTQSITGDQVIAYGGIGSICSAKVKTGR